MYIERLNILSNSCNAIDDSMNVMSHHFEQNEIFKKLTLSLLTTDGRERIKQKSFTVCNKFTHRTILRWGPNL